MASTTSIERRLRIAVACNAAIVVIQVVFGLASRSLGLLADAGHNLGDVVGVALSLAALRMARRRPTPQRSFGYHRSTILAAQANAAGVLVITAVLAVEAIRRFGDAGTVDAPVVLVVAALGAVVNAGAALLLTGHGGDLNVRGAVLHLAGDALASVAVVVTAAVMAITDGNWWLDPAVTLVIGVAIAWRAVALLREANDVLLESTPTHVDLDALRATMREVPGVEQVHDLHVWSLSSDLHALSAHVVVQGHPTLEDAQRTSEAVKAAIVGPYAIAHATIELECEACVDDDHDPCAATPREGEPLVPAHGHAGHGHEHEHGHRH